MTGKIISVIDEVINEVVGSNERRLIVISGNKPGEIAGEVVKRYVKRLDKKVSILYVYEDSSEDPRTAKRLRSFLETIEELDGKISTKIMGYKDTKEVMGTTWKVLVLDLFEQLKPNDLGRLIETVAGEGLIILQTPPFNMWTKIITLFQKRLVTHPYTERDIKHRFIKRFIRKLSEHSGIRVIDLEEKKVYGKPLKPRKESRPPIIVPEDRIFERELYEIAKTQDQVEILKLMETLLKEDEEKKKVLVITANRGRGKSAVLGIGIAAIMKRWLSLGTRRRVIITAPEPSNVKVLFDFLARGLRTLGIEYDEEKSGDQIIGIRTGKVLARYMEPYDVPAKKRDLVIVDEAAGIPVPMLFNILEQAKRVVYSSTIHGYEGAGRGFSVRFLKSLKDLKKIDLKTFQMTEPIRYAFNDPIERWLYDVLLLDAEPVDLTEQEKQMDVTSVATYFIPDLDDWYLGKGERELRDFIGIYVLAHYRNRPDDLAILADAPHHTARALKLPNGKIVTSIQLTYEGGLLNEIISKIMEEDYDAPGNLIPTVVLKHYFIAGFGKLRGIRVVRIAVHPELMDRGLGSKALEGIEMEARMQGFDWVGASFGASKLLLNFWLKNGYIPVHISPIRNPVSGEYSVIVVKPLTEECWKVVRELNKHLKYKLIEALSDIYYFLEPEVARLLFKFGRLKSSMITLNKVQWTKARMYATGRMIYEAAVDAIRLLVKKYFVEMPSTLGFSEKDELLLIAKCLQGRTWSETSKVTKMKIKRIKQRLRELIGKIYEYYAE